MKSVSINDPAGTTCPICGKPVTSDQKYIYSKRSGGITFIHAECFDKENGKKKG